MKLSDGMLWLLSCRNISPQSEGIRPVKNSLDFISQIFILISFESSNLFTFSFFLIIFFNYLLILLFNVLNINSMMNKFNIKICF